MIYASIDKSEEKVNRRLGFYLAMEEYLATHRKETGLFFMWQVNPTVICGRNQEVELETDLDYCRREGIEIVRRKSGGGCVFADQSNVMFSYIADSTDVRSTFSEYTGRVASMLRELGLDATDNSRNDILIGDRKVSGCAFYHLPGRSIVHGTMLYDTDGRHIANALTPSRAKLNSKGVKSVASRITTVREHLPGLSLEDFKRHSRENLCGDREIILTRDELKSIEEIERTYYDPDWTFRRIGRSATGNRTRVEGVGEINVAMSVDADGRIGSISLSGDFFSNGDATETLNAVLVGVKAETVAVREALGSLDMSKIIIGLKNEDFLNLLRL